MSKKVGVILTTLTLLMFSSALALSDSNNKDLKKKESDKFHLFRKGDPASERLDSFKKHKEMKEGSIFKNLKFRSVGPLAVSARIVDIEASSDVPYAMFLAFASGGLWKTTNDGVTWESLFDEEETIIMGDIAVQWPEADVIWIGTGENNSSRSSYSGVGVYKTNDGGKTWNHMGLEGTHRIGRIVINPENPDMVYVAALGALYSNNQNRGLYKTTDGGKTWKKILYVNDRTGCVDLVMHPENPNILWAAMWERDRRAWNFLESGPGSGIYKTTDGGKTWKKLTKGLPGGWCVGRIGLDVVRSKPDILYAFIDNQCLRPKDEPNRFEDEDLLKPHQIKVMNKDEFLKLSDDKINTFLNYYGFKREYDSKKIKKMLEDNEIGIEDIINYIGDANVRLFETRVIGSELYRSDDGGETWKRTHDDRIDQMYYTYGYYFGQVRVHPVNDKKVYIMGVPIGVSDDGGKTFKGIWASNVHADMHAFWIDPKYPNRVLLGNDGGLNVSYDGGENWRLINNLPVVQFYTVEVDMAKPYNIYGGTQDNGTVMGPCTFQAGYSKPWKSIFGGDGAYVQVNPKDNDTVFLEYQFGNIFRINLKSGARKSIKPRHNLKEQPLRYNWQSPILMSPHNQDVIYFGTNRLYRSLNRGDDWSPISPDLTANLQPQGDVPFGTITTISESHLQFGLLYVGTDDGKVYVTKGGGHLWSEITEGLPEKKWITRVIASKYDVGMVYVTLNGYRDDDFKTYVYKSQDYGRNWESIKGNLPDEPVNVIKEDPENKNILYLGTDLGLYSTLDGGNEWHALMGEFPNAPVHDLVIHPRDKDIVVATHGRSIYVLSVKNIQKLNNKILDKPVHLFEVDSFRHKPWSWDFSSLWRKQRRKPGLDITYYTKEAGSVRLMLKNSEGNVLKEVNLVASKGMNQFRWDYSVDKALVESIQKKQPPAERKYKDKDLKKKDKKLFVLPGKYTIEIRRGEESSSTPFEVKPKRKVRRRSPGARPKGP